MINGPNTVFILGAGASRQAGAPLMHDFLDVAKDLLVSGKIEDKQKAQSFERVFKAIGQLQAVHSKAQLDLVNIESVFNAFEFLKVIKNQHLIKKLPSDSASIDTLLTDLKTLIAVTLEETIRFPVYVRDKNNVKNQKLISFIPYDVTFS